MTILFSAAVKKKKCLFFWTLSHQTRIDFVDSHSHKIFVKSGEVLDDMRCHLLLDVQYRLGP